ncbi:PREDICTED: uncharacterized protein LOC104699624 isoform X2 [Camelina sativa]|uniref:Uncharacterized protein LOC104699624 isoform X2 n=1 Tax=Camelina sativa TaxID=90675 RepID=A0ABM0SM43_CAMSA|nr:PREDICTED: uncharacterized protein LOC104699624 isoform X2 [Camelina sativa]
MFAGRVRASLKPLFDGRYYKSSSVTRNGEITEVSKRILQERDGEQIMSSTGIGLGLKLFNRSFHSSPQCSDTSESDVKGVRTLAPALFSHLEDDLFSELGPVEKDLDRNVIVKMLTQKPELVQKTKSKKKKKKKKHDQASDSVSKPMLLTEKPEVSWKTNGKRKTEAHASSAARDVSDSNVSFSKPTMPSSPVQDLNSKSQSIISPSSEPRNESSKGSATSNTPSNHPSSVVVIRIGNLNSKTADSMIHSMCLSLGPLEGLARVNEDTVDVLYRVKKRNEADSILEELKDSTVDNSQWTAEIVPEAEEASKDEMGLRITSCCKKLDKHLLMQRILGKDLEVLLHSVMHLENHPMARDRRQKGFSLGCSQEA